MPVWMQDMHVILIPWVTALLLTLGMALVVCQTLKSGSWGAVGSIGIVSIGLVLTAYMFTGVVVWVGMLLLLVGMALLLVEARVLPGHGISALLGVGSEFAGLYITLAAVNGVLYSILVSSLYTLLSVVALFIYISRSALWHDLVYRLQLGHRVRITVAHPYTTTTSLGYVETSCKGTVSVQNVKETRAEYGQQTSQEEEQNQQIVGHDSGE